MAEITLTIDTEQQKQAVSDSFAKLDPRYLVKNPVLFVVELGTIIGLAMTIAPGLFGATGSRVYYAVITVLLGFTVIFANYAEAYAELEGEAQADSLRALQTETEGKRLLDEDVDIEDVSEDHAVLLVEHNMDIVMRVSDRIVVLNQGAVIADAEPEAIRNDPKVQEAYLGGYEEGDLESGPDSTGEEGVV